MTRASIVLAGLGGYGSGYAERLLAGATPAVPVAGIEPDSENVPAAAEFAERGIPVFPDFDAFLASGIKADAVVVSTPIHTHAEIAVAALDSGMDVFCEKPLAGCASDVAAMALAEKRSGRRVAVGFQWSHEPCVIRMAGDIADGRFGSPKRLKTIALHPRSACYYSGRPWRGAIRSSDGRSINESPLSNALAHYLHHMLYILGGRGDSAANVSEVLSEVYRAKAIENFDTCAVRCLTDSGTEVLFIASLSTKGYRGPVCEFEFDKATVFFDYDDAPERFLVRFDDGSEETYGPLEHDSARKLDMFLEALESGAPFSCGLRAATPHVQCVEAVRRESEEIPDFPTEISRIGVDPWDGGELTYIEGLDTILFDCYERWALPSELGGLEWAAETRKWGPPCL